MDQRQHLMYVYINEDMDDTNVNPMDADDPETAYREYLAERFSR